MRLKNCSVCQLEKERSEFHKRSASKDGLSPKCKLCDKIKNSEWRAKNGERQKEYKRDYWNKNSDTIKQSNRNWQQANPDKIKTITGKWNQANKGKRNELSARRRAARLQATPLWSDQKRIAEFYEAASFCTEFFGVEFHVDHIVPLQSKIVCGLHNEFNLQVIVGKENLKKSNRFWPDMPE